MEGKQPVVEEEETWNFEAPYHSGTSIKKNMRRHLRSLYYDWFHDDGGADADMDAGIHEDGEEQGLPVGAEGTTGGSAESGGAESGGAESGGAESGGAKAPTSTNESKTSKETAKLKNSPKKSHGRRNSVDETISKAKAVAEAVAAKAAAAIVAARPVPPTPKKAPRPTAQPKASDIIKSMAAGGGSNPNPGTPVTQEKRATMSPEVKEKTAKVLGKLPRIAILTKVAQAADSRPKVISEVPEVEKGKALADEPKSLDSGMKHITKRSGEGGYSVYQVLDHHGKIEYYWYKDKTGSTRKLTGGPLEAARKHFVGSFAAHSLERNRGKAEFYKKE